MTAGTFTLLSYIAYGAAGLMVALAVLFFFLFKIPEVIGDLSGRTARKNIAKIRSANERSGDKSFTPGRVNEDRGKLTKSMRLDETSAKGTVDLKSSQNTTRLAGEGAATTDLLNDRGGFIREETDVLPGTDETTPLTNADAEETTPLREAEETTPLREAEETAPLREAEETAPLREAEETAPLREAEETAPLAGPAQAAPIPAETAPPAAAAAEETTRLDEPAAEETTRLNEPAPGETELLSGPGKTPLQEKGWVLLESVVLIHTEEVIR